MYVSRWLYYLGKVMCGQHDIFSDRTMFPEIRVAPEEYNK